MQSFCGFADKDLCTGELSSGSQFAFVFQSSGSIKGVCPRVLFAIYQITEVSGIFRTVVKTNAFKMILQTSAEAEGRGKWNPWNAVLRIARGVHDWGRNLRLYSFMSLKCDLTDQHSKKGKNASTTVYFRGLSMKTVFSGKWQFLVSEYMDTLSKKKKKNQHFLNRQGWDSLIFYLEAIVSLLLSLQLARNIAVNGISPG